MNIEQIAQLIAATPRQGAVRMVALVGAPAGGKSTLADALAEHDKTISVVPMDGFHLDNGLLGKRGLRDRKGAPETFDSAGLAHILRRCASGERPFYPVFDRASDRSIAGAGEVGENCETVLVEGNYLLLDRPGWRTLHPIWDISIQLNVSLETLHERLLGRWRRYGFSDEEAESKVLGNDLPNAQLVMTQSVPADVMIDSVTF